MRTERWIEDWGKGFDDKLRCARCVYDADTPNISFDSHGVCNYCHQWDQLDRQYPTGEQGMRALERIAHAINHRSQGKKYNVVVGVSGGCDSSYTLYLAKQLGLRPLAVHYDNTWNSDIAVSNIRNVLDTLETDLHTYVVDNAEVDDIYRSFFRAGAKELDAITDIALTEVHMRAALKHGIQYIFEGHSFRTEGVAPLGWMYMDGKYIQDLHSKYGSGRLKSFPLLKLAFQIRTILINRFKRIRPLWYIDYDKEEAKRFMTANLGWQWYNGHHLENRMTAFHHTYWSPRKFGTDLRVLGFAGLIRAGQMTREDALAELKTPPPVDYQLVDLVKKRLGVSDEEFEQVMEGPKRSYKDFKTYKPTFERLRPLIKIAADHDLVPRSFYLKFACKQD